ncbi:MAG: beta galactosidase jelly roll domain-containing protein [Cyclobacteriaceae bacterium]|jgi:hypothetical protein|nr:beta galactosidase jelly roll domain-containing protein [Flammeovirgaceae bacterium]
MRFYFATLFLLFSITMHGQVIPLNGLWKFTLDDESVWAEADYDDTRWGNILAPSPWEDKGFNGYDGFAWYRKKFDGKKLNKQENYYLNLGYIDDCDEVYVNGKLIGFSGTMPPHFKTAYNSERKYNIPNDLINFNGMNVIAVRVFDVTLGGGIIDGRLGIYATKKNHLLLDLQGVWSFATSWNDKPIKNESSWKRILVPGPWDHQGYYKYDGFAWYKKTFVFPENGTTENLMLLMGKIDDFDKVYLNGKLIGSTNDHEKYGWSESYQEKRAYSIPSGLLKKGAENVIEVLVEDMGNTGGIYEGPVGIVTKSDYEWYFR